MWIDPHALADDRVFASIPPFGSQKLSRTVKSERIAAPTSWSVPPFGPILRYGGVRPLAHGSGCSPWYIATRSRTRIIPHFRSWCKLNHTARADLYGGKERKGRKERNTYVSQVSLMCIKKQTPCQSTKVAIIFQVRGQGRTAAPLPSPHKWRKSRLCGIIAHARTPSAEAGYATADLGGRYDPDSAPHVNNT